MNVFYLLLSLENQEIAALFLRKARSENRKRRLRRSIMNVFYQLLSLENQEIAALFLRKAQSENTKRRLRHSLGIFYAWLRSPASWDRP